MGLIEAADSAEKGGSDQPAARLSSPDAQGMGLDRVDADDIVNAVPFDCAEGLKYGRAECLDAVDLVGTEQFKPDLSRRQRLFRSGCIGSEGRRET
jgi:hypothetical protein